MVLGLINDMFVALYLYLRALPVMPMQSTLENQKVVILTSFSLSVPELL